MELLEPVEGVGDEEVAHLGPAVVEDVGAPLGVPAEPGVGVLVERQPVEARERPLVGGEVTRHPVEQHADAGAVQLVDEVAEVVGAAPPGARGVVAGDVVAPRRDVGVLHDRQELDVGEAEVAHVVDEVLGEAVVADVLAPRAEVHLVDAHRALVDVGGAASLHPVVVAPRVVGLGDDGRLLGRDLGHARHRVALEPDELVGPAHGELVVHPLVRARQEELPDAAVAERAHRVGAAVPVVEVADDVDGLGPRSPQREGHAPHVAERAGVVPHVGAEHGPQLLVAALVDEVPVDLAEGRGEAVGVVLLVLDAVAVLDEQAVVVRRAEVGRGHRPDAVAHVLQLDPLARVEARADARRIRAVCRDGEPPGSDVVAQQVVRLAVAAVEEGGDGSVVERRAGRGLGGHGVPSSVVSRSTAPSGMGSHVGRLRAS